MTVSRSLLAAGHRIAAASTAVAAVGLLASKRIHATRPRGIRCETIAAGQEQTLKQFLKSSLAQKWVELNADKTKSCLVNTDEADWIQTGAGGVRRKLIERLGGEVARATTVVSFEPNTRFPSHEHEGGEEFIVLEGEWFDDWAAQPKYTYVRNYIGSRHTPRIGSTGATIFVKLCQMSKEYAEPEHSQWDIAPAAPGWTVCPNVPGRVLLEVFASPHERVRFERWTPGTRGEVLVPATGEEIFVMEGSFDDELGCHRTWSWARNAGDQTQGEARRMVRAAGARGCLLYVKSHHLRSPEVDIVALQPSSKL